MTQALRKSALLGCNKCSFRESRRRVVPGSGPVPCDICLIGEAPGFVEDTLGVPFAGRSGDILKEAIRSTERAWEDLYITNAVKCRPPDNRIPTSAEVRICTEAWLWDELNVVKPERIITLGRVSTSLFFAFSSLAKIEGRSLSTYVARLFRHVWIYPVYHPAAIIYNPKLRGRFFSSMKEALK